MKVEPTAPPTTPEEPVMPEPHEEEKKPPMKHKKRKKASGKPSTNPWITHYMQWRAANKDIVDKNKDVKQLVALARKTYTPVRKGFTCSHCGKDNVPPYTPLLNRPIN